MVSHLMWLVWVVSVHIAKFSQWGFLGQNFDKITFTGGHRTHVTVDITPNVHYISVAYLILELSFSQYVHTSHVWFFSHNEPKILHLQWNLKAQYLCNIFFLLRTSNVTWVWQICKTPYTYCEIQKHHKYTLFSGINCILCIPSVFVFNYIHP